MPGIVQIRPIGRRVERPCPNRVSLSVRVSFVNCTSIKAASNYVRPHRCRDDGYGDGGQGVFRKLCRHIMCVCVYDGICVWAGIFRACVCM